jgi:hypothetical protein
MNRSTPQRVAVAALALLAGLTLTGSTAFTAGSEKYRLGLEIMERRNAATFRRWETVPHYAWLHYKKFFRLDYDPDGHRSIGYTFHVSGEDRSVSSFDLHILSMKGKDTLSVVREGGWESHEPYYFTRPVYDVEKQIIRVQFSPRDHFTFAVRFDDVNFVADEADE